MTAGARWLQYLWASWGGAVHGVVVVITLVVHGNLQNLLSGLVAHELPHVQRILLWWTVQTLSRFLGLQRVPLLIPIRQGVLVTQPAHVSIHVWGGS